ncbi:hypothetical protein [Sorangium sp. So ce426]|uniref:hypothetical protein n=1 Tax=Sorangium sp. So ce426 TaxID=3133312 RepID=UPI003F5B013F
MKRIPRIPRLQRVQCTRRTLQFKHHLGVELAGDKETVFLIGERERTMLRGRVVHLVGPPLDGRRTADELVAALDEREKLTQRRKDAKTQKRINDLYFASLRLCVELSLSPEPWPDV